MFPKLFLLFVPVSSYSHSFCTQGQKTWTQFSFWPLVSPPMYNSISTHHYLWNIAQNCPISILCLFIFFLLSTFFLCYFTSLVYDLPKSTPLSETIEEQVSSLSFYLKKVIVSTFLKTQWTKSKFSSIDFENKIRTLL